MIRLECSISVRNCYGGPHYDSFWNPTSDTSSGNLSSKGSGDEMICHDWRMVRSETSSKNSTGSVEVKNPSIRRVGASRNYLPLIFLKVNGSFIYRPSEILSGWIVEIRMKNDLDCYTKTKMKVMVLCLEEVTTQSWIKAISVCTSSKRSP